MRKGVLKPKILNDILRGGNSKARIGSVRDEAGKWWSIYLATDSETGRVRRNVQGDLLINVKPQKDWPQIELIDEPVSLDLSPSLLVDDAAAWQD